MLTILQYLYVIYLFICNQKRTNDKTDIGVYICITYPANDENVSILLWKIFDLNFKSLT